jgi:hypothetical protein
MKKVVVESPLGGNFAYNRRYALLCALDCSRRGEAAYASHLFYPQFLDDLSVFDRAFGIAAGFEWAKSADLVAFYVDLGISSGMIGARDHWTSLGMTIENRNLPVELMQKLQSFEPLGKTPGF